jgi:hypothetical protein
MRLAWFLLVFAMISTGCSVRIGPWKIGAPAIAGSGIVAVEERTIEPYSEIEVSGAIQTEVELGIEPSLSVAADDNLLEFIECKVVNGKLLLSTTESMSTSNPILVKTTTARLNAYKGSGATRGTLVGLASEEFAVQLSGASTLTTSVGNAKHLTVRASGASSFEGSELVSDHADVHVSGASKARIGITETLIAHASGASSVRYSGAPATVRKDTSGASSIQPVEE